MLARYTDILITINREDYERARKFHLNKNGKLFLHPGVGVDVKRFADIEVDRDAKRKILGIDEGQIVFFTVGELIKRKNQDVLIEAMRKLGRKDVIFLVAGDGERKNILKEKIDELGLQNQVKMLGFRSDIPELLKVVDCFVLPSFQEGLPGALMEAVASGLPCIASNIRGNVDILGDSNFIFAPNDSDRLTGFMILMLDKDIRSSEAAKNKLRAMKFDISESIKAYKDIYSLL